MKQVLNIGHQNNVNSMDAYASWTITKMQGAPSRIVLILLFLWPIKSLYNVNTWFLFELLMMWSTTKLFMYGVLQRNFVIMIIL
jgi:hypothetical protein